MMKERTRAQAWLLPGKGTSLLALDLDARVWELPPPIDNTHNTDTAICLSWRRNGGDKREVEEEEEERWRDQRQDHRDHRNRISSCFMINHQCNHIIDAIISSMQPLLLTLLMKWIFQVVPWKLRGMAPNTISPNNAREGGTRGSVPPLPPPLDGCCCCCGGGGGCWR